MHAKLQQQSDTQDKQVKLKPVSKHGEPDVEIIEPESSDDENRE